jgi:structural maintenance of chromosome 1
MSGQLKSLELENFKSYKGRQVIGPLKSFTAIIGPNGSGKSNFMDAISFVLGEKAQNLRVKKLSELIHGASIGQPASNTASVTLVYQDNETQRVTRFCRYVVGASSEFKIDEANVSKHDYGKRLEGIGISIKAKNFLVYQGAVESIAMKNPKEITAMFEEISHSNEYKEDYCNYKVRMNQSEEELHHMYMKKKGIAAEKKEAQGEINEAKKYENLKEDLRVLQQKLQLFKLYYINEELQGLNKDIEKKRNELNKHVKRKDDVNAKVKEKKSVQTKLSKTLANIDKQIREAELNLNKKRPAYIKAKENASHIEKKLETARKSLTSARKTHNNHEEAVNQLKQELEKINRKIKKFNEELEQRNEARRNDIVLEESQKTEYIRLKEEASRLSAKYLKDMDSYEREFKAESDKYENEVRKQQEIEARIKFMQNEREENLKRIEKLKDNIAMSETNYNELKSKDVEVDQCVKNSKERIQEINKELDQINGELGDAKVDRHEDDRRRKKAEVVENLKKLYPGVYDRLLNMCKPTHKRYNIGITRVMGKSMEAIVVDSERTGRLCIQYLKDQMMEPETFLPLDYIANKPLKERLRNVQHPKGVRLVFDVLKFEPPAINKAVLYATNNALICETPEDANVVAFDLGDGKRYDAVALDGTFYQKCGFISGGSAELERRARRWDEKELHTLKHRKEKLAEELKDHLKKTRKESDLNVIQSQIRGLETRLRYSKIDLQTTEKRNDEIKMLIVRHEEELEDLVPKMQEIKKRLNEFQSKIDLIRESMNGVEDEIFRDFCTELNVENIREYEERQNKESQENESKKLQLESEKNSIQSRLSYEISKDTSENVKRWEKSIELEESNLESARAVEKKEMKAIEAEMDNVEKLKNDKIFKKSELDQVEETINEDKKQMNLIQKDISNVQKGLMAIECRLESKKADRHGIYLYSKLECIDLPLVGGTLENVVRANNQNDDDDEQDTGETTDQMLSQNQRSYEGDNDIKPDFELLNDNLLDYEDQEQIKRKENEFQTEIDRKKEILRKIQAPNMRAIEKLDDVKERLKETDSELNNLRNSSKNAKNEFEKIKKLRYDTFTECFEAITMNVDQIYKALTNNRGAQAFLVPENPEEPYLEGESFAVER